MKKVLIVYNGWNGHDPLEITQEYKRILEEEKFEVEIASDLTVFEDQDKLYSKDLIVVHCSYSSSKMGVITMAQIGPVLNAVASGVGLAGCHAGLCDAFHNNVDWQFMTGGQWVCHPGGQAVDYIVNISQKDHEIMRDIRDFHVESELYYMHVDPAIQVLATTRVPPPAVAPPYTACNHVELHPENTIGTYNFEVDLGWNGPHVENRPIDMPIVWTKTFGKGRVFYSSIGHSVKTFKTEPAITIMRRGLVWAAK